MSNGKASNRHVSHGLTPNFKDRHDPWAMLRSSFIFGLCILLLSPRESFAQYNTAEMSGSVRDEQGGQLPGVSVIAVNSATGLRLERVTDTGGRFFLAALPVGDYTLTVELAGFRRFTRTGLVLRVGEKLEVPITLQLGQLTDTITVAAEPPLL